MFLSRHPSNLSSCPVGGLPAGRRVDPSERRTTKQEVEGVGGGDKTGRRSRERASHHHRGDGRVPLHFSRPSLRPSSVSLSKSVLSDLISRFIYRKRSNGPPKAINGQPIAGGMRRPGQ